MGGGGGGESGISAESRFFGGQPHLSFKETDVALISTLVTKSPKTFCSFPKIILTHLFILIPRLSHDCRKYFLLQGSRAALRAFKFLDLNMLHHEYKRVSVFISLSSLVTR